LATFRPYVTPSDGGTSLSGGFTLTRYFADADTYWRIRASAGKSIQVNSFLNTLTNVVSLRSNDFGVAGQWSPMRATFVGLSFDHARQELQFAPGQFVDVNSFTVMAFYRF
jgi:YaiO family outer membrane protein